jgi:hypothetical protein
LTTVVDPKHQMRLILRKSDMTFFHLLRRHLQLIFSVEGNFMKSGISEWGANIRDFMFRSLHVTHCEDGSEGFNMVLNKGARPLKAQFITLLDGSTTVHEKVSGKAVA